MDRVKPRTLAYFSVMLFLIGLAGGLYLHQASEVAGYAKEIRRLQMRKERIHRELVILEGEAALLGSLDRVMRVGKDLGYRLPEAATVKDHVYVECTPTPPAQVSIPALEGDAESSDEIALHINNTIWKDLVSQFYLWFQSPAGQRRR
jgi:hypothetical protein